VAAARSDQSVRKRRPAEDSRPLGEECIKSVKLSPCGSNHENPDSRIGFGFATLDGFEQNVVHRLRDGILLGPIEARASNSPSTFELVCSLSICDLLTVRRLSAFDR
jgi:hypothetical protein